MQCFLFVTQVNIEPASLPYNKRDRYFSYRFYAMYDLYRTEGKLPREIQ